MGVSSSETGLDAGGLGCADAGSSSAGADKGAGGYAGRLSGMGGLVYGPGIRPIAVSGVCRSGGLESSTTGIIVYGR